MSVAAGTPVLRVVGLRKEYGRGAGLVRAVDGVDLEIAPGQTLAVMGPSGSGKSTLLHLLGSLDRASAGEIWLAGERIDTGLVWLTRADAASLATADNPLTYYLNLKLADPATAPAFVDVHQPSTGFRTATADHMAGPQQRSGHHHHPGTADPHAG